MHKAAIILNCFITVCNDAERSSDRRNDKWKLVNVTGKQTSMIKLLSRHDKTKQYISNEQYITVSIR